jgi:hypothetical protein
MTKREQLRELVAEALYKATMGEGAILPWPASNADNYRRLADAAIDATLKGLVEVL